MYSVFHLNHRERAKCTMAQNLSTNKLNVHKIRHEFETTMNDGEIACCALPRLDIWRSESNTFDSFLRVFTLDAVHFISFHSNGAEITGRSSFFSAHRQFFSVVKRIEIIPFFMQFRCHEIYCFQFWISIETSSLFAVRILANSRLFASQYIMVDMHTFYVRSININHATVGRNILIHQVFS